MGASAFAPRPVLPVVAPRWAEPGRVPPQVTLALEDSLSLPGVLCALLAARGYEDPERAKAFLRPVLSDLDPPELLAGIQQAVARIDQAIDEGQTILVHGDYDVDGVAGTALLTRWIRRLGGSAVPFVPHRVTDGYDLGLAGLEAASKAGAALIVTVDSGIRAHDVVARASADGYDVIVTDHHPPAPTPTRVCVGPGSHTGCPSCWPGGEGSRRRSFTLR